MKILSKLTKRFKQACCPHKNRIIIDMYLEEKPTSKTNTEYASAVGKAKVRCKKCDKLYISKKSIFIINTKTHQSITFNL